MPSMDSEIIFNVVESPEGGYEAKALGFSIFTEADTLEQLKRMIQDAVRCHFEDGQRPRLIRLHLVKDEVIPVLESREEKGQLVACKVPATDPIAEVFGCLGKGLDTEQFIAEIRGRR